MNKNVIFGFFVFTLALSSNELAWVDHQIDAIKPPRIGVAAVTIAALNDPFIFLEKKVTLDTTNTVKQVPATSGTFAFKTPLPTAPTLKLAAIMNGAALINGKWCKIGDTVQGYKVVSLDLKSAHLTNKNKKLTLSTQSDSKNLKFKNK
ncbi:MAG TPA: hypothetical protein CFH84_05560 [Sulfurimonas sp. UBA12504]|nr:MAG: hypothetical protein A2019_08400 [Sulfurimonas sp. GWF2_37_8]DAB30173.1 MAG TPA: hypothetical protein CFH84_05560 [Sulfurimonas sp. UBA12504]